MYLNYNNNRNNQNNNNRDTHIVLDFLHDIGRFHPTETQSCGLSFYTCPKHAIAKSQLRIHRAEAPEAQTPINLILEVMGVLTVLTISLTVSH